MQAHSVMFHYLHNNQHPATQGSISDEELEQMITYIGRERIIDASEFLHRAAASDLRPGDVAFSFDDGLRCHYEVAGPVLRKHNIKAFFFVNTAPLDGVLDRLEIYRIFRNRCFKDVEQFNKEFEEAVVRSKYGTEARERLRDFDPKEYLKHLHFYSDGDRTMRFLRDQVLGKQKYEEILEEMISERTTVEALCEGAWMDQKMLCELREAGHLIGLHTHNHPTTCDQLSDEEVRNEYSTNAAHLKRALGTQWRPETAAYPCGKLTQTTPGILNGMGVKMAFMASFSEKGPFDDPFRVQRTDSSDVMRLMCSHSASEKEGKSERQQ
uniref:NodB homology domain-containing protein n=1 Tax=Chromera velia CCMP2878 TaxID=1169474 RepID=A0A0G4FPX4_9ALVE|eukprot:Cvel_17962.t1-p1 / transcript=Cvel_17962.t1 / gene=Cvel_17962 / organism=Chromera_velia_CCMP2878 / gene_product=hypothetical protein / transcript_product=hypothetical protein / location=Cvel_scaffold1461:41090-43028(-) / protein_length=324 / sequence_SO=supercontig / SO=protein_coding / is_pseudo=false